MSDTPEQRSQRLYWTHCGETILRFSSLKMETVLFCSGAALYGMQRKPVSWKISDLIDFEWFLAEDSDLDDKTLRSRDRQIYEKISRAKAPSQSESRGDIFRAWLEERRAQASEASPGDYFLTAWQTLSVCSAIFGVSLGISVAAAVLLTYRGQEPVNVAWFFACTVGIQWLILAGGLAIWALRRTTHLLENFHPIRRLLSGMLWSLSAALHQLPGNQREKIRARLTGIRRRGEIFQLLVWPLLMITQIFGVFFNAGVLTALLLPLGRDVAFGWQSTLKTSPAAVYALVSSIATPWSFLPNPHPTPEEVVQSRFSYSEGIGALSEPAMTSWWPFLFYATLTYGFLVRLILLIWCGVNLRVALRRFSFDHASCSALFRRLTGPFIQGHPDAAKLDIPQSTPSLAHSASGTCLALAAKELELEEEEIQRSLSRDFSWRLSKPLLAVRIDDRNGNGAAFERIASEAPSLASIAVLISERRAPIRAIALVLRKIFEAAGGKVEIVVLLVDSSEAERSEATETEQFAAWRNFLAIHDLPFGLERWRL